MATQANVGIDNSRLNITVSDPIKQGEGMSAHISYRIDTQTDLPAFAVSQMSVVRRYSDFVWLHNQLEKFYLGVIIPPLPEKIVIGRFSPEFIERRRRGLEKFLNRIAAHPELVLSQYFAVFLQGDETSFEQAKLDVKGSRKSRGLKQWWFDTTAVVSKTMGSVPERPKNPDELAMEEINRYVGALEPQITNVHKHTQAYIEKGKNVSDALAEFGIAFSLLGQSESNVLGTALTQLGATADKISVLYADQAERETVHFEEPLKDYMQLTAAVKGALVKREDKGSSFDLARGDLQSKQANYQKQIGPQGRPEKVPAAEAEVQQAMDAVAESKKELDAVTTKLMGEVGAFRQQKLVDFREMILDFVQLQIAHHQQVEEAWTTLIPDLEAIDTNAEVIAAAVAAEEDDDSAYGSQPAVGEEEARAESGDGKVEGYF